jgi:hypothetical protein
MANDDGESTSNAITRHLAVIAAGVAQLVRNETTIAGTEGRILGGIDRVSERLDKIETTLNGSGDGKSGVAARLTRVEEMLEQRSRSITAWAPVLAAFISACAAVVVAVIYILGNAKHP